MSLATHGPAVDVDAAAVADDIGQAWPCLRSDGAHETSPAQRAGSCLTPLFPFPGCFACRYRLLKRVVLLEETVRVSQCQQPRLCGSLSPFCDSAMLRRCCLLLCAQLYAAAPSCEHATRAGGAVRLPQFVPFLSPPCGVWRSCRALLLGPKKASWSMSGPWPSLSASGAAAATLQRCPRLRLGRTHQL